MGSTIAASYEFRRDLVTIEENDGYHMVRYAGAYQDEDAGRSGWPQLPYFGFHFSLPPDTFVDSLIVTVVSADTLEGRYTPRPIQGDDGQTLPDPDAYRETFPDQPANVTGSGKLQNYFLGSIGVYPIQYIGETQQLVVIEEVLVELVLQPTRFGGVGPTHRRHRPDPRPPALNDELQWVLRSVDNPEDFERDYVPGRSMTHGLVEEERPFGGFIPTEFPTLDGPPVELVIITDSLDVGGAPVGDLVGEFQALADWRTRSGVPAVVKTVSWISENYPGLDRPERIRNFLKDASSYWGTRFVCLGGDITVVPTRLIGAPGTGNSSRVDQPADAYYSELDRTWNADGDAYWVEAFDNSEFGGSEEYLDLWVGRLPARDAAEAAIMVRKILEYERAPGSAAGNDGYGAAYYSRFLFAAGLTNSPQFPSSANGVDCAETIAGSIESNSLYSSAITRMYCEAPDATPLCGSTPKRCYEDLYDLWSTALPTPVPFTGPAFRDSLESGHHIVFHAEHSWRDQLGGPSNGTNLTDTSCSNGAWRTTCFDLYKSANASGFGNPLTREMVDGLGNGPRYSVVFSGGSYTNQWDLDAIGEHFLRTPNGGAVAYFGKNASFGGLESATHQEILEQSFVEDVGPIGEATGLAQNLQSSSRMKKAIDYNLLADPSMVVWGESPDTLTITQSPGSITQLGTQTVVINVQVGSTNVEGARVCLQQGDDAYVVAWTDDQGDATFASVALNSADDVTVTASKRNLVPKTEMLKFGSLASAHHVIYDRHSRDDWFVGDGDDILEAGEAQELRVTARDNGSDISSTDDVWAHLWATAPIICDLRVEGAYDPTRIFLGAENAHPPFAVQDTFRIPANWEAIRLEGEPDGSIGTGGMYFHMWRDTTAVYHIRSKTYPTSPDSLLTGILLTRGGFSDVSWSAETGGGPDSVYYDAATPDSIWFQFARDGSDDELFFRAEAADWISVLTDSVGLGTMAAGDTASGVFDVEFSGDVPDREEVVFTLATREEHESWWFSDFSETVHAPEVRLISSKRSFVAGGPGVVYMNVVPTVSNVGSATADTSIATLTVQSGSSTLIDGVVPLSSVAAGDTLKATQSFRLSAPTQAAHQSLVYALEIRTYHPNGDSTVWYREGLDVVSPSAVTGLITDEMNGAVVLRWDKSAASDLEGYHVFQSMPGSLTRLTREPIVGTSKFEVSGLDALSGGGLIDYRYAVTAADLSGNESSKTWSDTASVWLPEKPGWPRRIPSGSATAVKAADVDGDGKLEIFAAGRKIYAWNHDGTPLITGNDDGLFYDPQDDGQAADSAKVFVQSLALGDLDADGNWEVVGNVARDGLYVAEYVSGTVNGRWQKDGFNSRLSPPIIANLDPANGDSAEVIFMIDGGAPNPSSIYVWNQDGSTWPGFTSVENDVVGAFLYRSVAVADVVPDTVGLEIVQTVVNPGVGASDRDKVYCWNGISGRLLWEADIPGQRAYTSPISCPVIADVDANDTLDVVVARGIERHPTSGAVREDGGIFVISWRPLLGGLEPYLVASSEDDSFEFTGAPLVTPVVANFDADDTLEVVVPGGTNGLREETARMHVFDLQPGGTLSETVATVDIPIPGRKFPSMHSDWTPVVADVDGDGNLDIISPTTHGWLTGWEWVDGSLSAKRGWPMFFPDIPSTPLIADADGDGDLEMIIQDYSGLVHMLELPGDTLSVREWWQFGGDLGNRFEYEGPRTGPAPRTGPQVGPAPDDLALFIDGPNPFGGESRLSLRLPRAGRTRVAVYDVAGRRVRTLVDRDLEAGRHALSWDARDSRGAMVANGVYFYVLEGPDKRLVLKSVRIGAGGDR